VDTMLATENRPAPPGLYGGRAMETNTIPGGAVGIRTVIVDGKPVRAGTADDVGALCISDGSPNGIPGRTYRWYAQHRPEHLRPPGPITDEGGNFLLDPASRSRLYDADAVEAWHKSRPGSAHAAPRPTNADTLNATPTRRDLLTAAANGQVHYDDRGRWGLRGNVPTRRIAQSLAELDALGVFARDPDGLIRLSEAGEKLRARWGTR
jgi:hypothetical protein